MHLRCCRASEHFLKILLIFSCVPWNGANNLAPVTLKKTINCMQCTCRYSEHEYTRVVIDLLEIKASCQISSNEANTSNARMPYMREGAEKPVSYK